MKKLIILSAIALSSLIYSSANAQERFRGGYNGRNERGFDNREHRAYFRPHYNYYRNEERFRFEDRFSRDRYQHRGYRW